MREVDRDGRSLAMPIFRCRCKSPTSNFRTSASPETLMTDHNGNGQYDQDDGDCWEDTNENGEFDTDYGTEGVGGASDVVIYSADISMPRLLPLDKFINVPSTIDMTVETAIRNQPYGGQGNPPVLCGSTVTL